MPNRSGPQRNRPRTGYGEVHVTGLVELQRALKDIDPELRKQLKGRLRKIALLVKVRVQQKMPSISGKARKAVKVGVTNTGAYVAHGGKSARYTPWLDFGGRLRPHGRRKGVQNRPILREGRYLYPAIKEMAPVTQREALEAFEATKRELGLGS